MDEVLGALTEQHEDLVAIVAPLDDAGWSTPSRCEGWTVSDVLLHLAQTDRLALASIEGRLLEEAATFVLTQSSGATVDDNVDAMVAAGRGEPGAVVFEQWRRGATALRAAFARGRPDDRLTWVAGELAARTLATTRLAECWIHTGDVAVPLGYTVEPAPRLWHIARLAWRTLPYAFRRAGSTLSGPVAFDLDGPGDRAWRFAPQGEATTTVSGDGLELCLVAARRVLPGETSLRGKGPDAEAVLELVRTWA